MSQSIMFVVGDPSGDHHTAPVLAALRAQFPDLRTFGIGGPNMQRAGFETLLPFAEFNRMGFWEVISHLPFFLDAKKRLIRELDRCRPSALVCVDYPGFNIPLMKAAHSRNVCVIWYIVPQVWAWKKARARILGEHAAFIGTVFPFEKELFAPFPASVDFVGHPLIEALGENERFAPLCTEDQALRERFEQGRLRISLVPGSRRQEIGHMLEPMAQATGLLAQKYPGIALKVSRSGSIPVEDIAARIKGKRIEIYDGPLDDLLAQTDLALVTSGTATLQTALWHIPMVICYKTSPLSYHVLKNVVSIDMIGMPNIISRRTIVPECIQHEVCARKLYSRLHDFMSSWNRYSATILNLSHLRRELGSKRPSTQIAAQIAAFLV
ncbi:MAG: lipid-A-disaccharide synthase [Chitinivibrionales bacterium]|nr:lipid-A-disaccharide synthase [Chitinivibrionales bacterium]